MPNKSFSSFHRKSAFQQEKLEPNDRVVDTNDVDEATYQDISAFPDNIATQITFRLSILRYLASKCEQIMPRTIEPHRVGLQRLHDRKIPSAISIYRWWLVFRASGCNPVSLAPKNKNKGNSKAKVPTFVDALMEQAVDRVISGRKVRIRSAYKRVRRKLRQHNLNNGTKYKYPTYESLRKRVKKKTPFELLAAKKGERVAKREVAPNFRT